MDLSIVLAVIAGGTGGACVAAVVASWFLRHRSPDADLDEVAAVVDAHSKALRRLTMQRVRQGADPATLAGSVPSQVSAAPPPGTPEFKQYLRSRVFSSIGVPGKTP